MKKLSRNTVSFYCRCFSCCCSRAGAAAGGGAVVGEATTQVSVTEGGGAVFPQVQTTGSISFAVVGGAERLRSLSGQVEGLLPGSAQATASVDNGMSAASIPTT